MTELSSASGNESPSKENSLLNQIDENREKWANYSGPKEVELPIRSRGGCEQNSRVQQDSMYLLLFSLLLWRRRLKRLNAR